MLFQRLLHSAVGKLLFSNAIIKAFASFISEFQMRVDSFLFHLVSGNC